MDLASSSAPGYHSFVDERVERYVSSVIDLEDKAARKQRKRCVELGYPHISPEAARTLAILARLAGARRILEVGTNIGYSGGFLARALPEDATVEAGEGLVTVEVDEEVAEEARTHFDAIGVADRVEVVVGDAAEVLPDLSPDPPFDLVFIDADKEGYPLYLEEALRLTRVGGAICADNLFWQGNVFKWMGDTATKKVVDFARSIGRDERLLSTILPLGDGLSVSVVVGE